MNKLLAIFRKDTIIRFSSVSEWLFFLILPVVFTLILAGGTGAPTDNRTRLTVVDQAQSDLSRQLISELEQSTTIRPVVKALQDAEQEFEKRNVSAVLIIPAGFTLNNLREGELELELRQQANNLGSLAAYQVVQAAIQGLSSGVEIARSSTTAAEAIQIGRASCRERV